MPIKAKNGNSIRFGDVAVVRRTFQQAQGWSRVNGEKAIVLEVRKRVGSNVIEAVEAARAIIDAAAPQISPEVKVSYLFDDSKEVRRMLSDLGNNVGAAVIIVMVVLATLGSRNATLVGLAIPGSFFVGITALNTLVVNISAVFAHPRGGHVADGVVVTTEYADRQIAMGASRRCL